MAPKGKAGDKGGAAKGGKGKGKAEEKEEKGGKVKASQFINVRHILVRLTSRKKRAGLTAPSVRNMARKRKLWRN